MKPSTQPMNGHDKREETLFNAALQLATPEERAAYLNNACPHDEPLRQRVLVLLHAHDQADAFLDKPAAGLPARTLVVNPALIQPTEKAGDKIGRPPNTTLGLMLAQAAQTGRPIRNRRVPITRGDGSGAFVALLSVDILEPQIG